MTEEPEVEVVNQYNIIWGEFPLLFEYYQILHTILWESSWKQKCKMQKKQMWTKSAVFGQFRNYSNIFNIFNIMHTHRKHVRSQINWTERIAVMLLSCFIQLKAMSIQNSLWISLTHYYQRTMTSLKLYIAKINATQFGCKQVVCEASVYVKMK